MNKKLLIVCYFFPPCPSIGGRRSAKFAKYLAKSGNEVHVIQAVNPFPNVSPWFKDIQQEKNVHRHELPLHYPVEFIIPPKSLYGKIKYRLYNLYFSLFHSNKNRYDYTIFWEKAYLKKAEELIRSQGIKNILVSGPPFYYAWYTTKLKDEFPDLNIIIDFRDPWIDSPYYGMSSLKSAQFNSEVNLLNKVYNKSDYFIGPNIFLLNSQTKYISKENKLGAKVVEVPHGYDRDEMATFIDTAPVYELGQKIRLVYGGQLYPGTDDILVKLDNILKAIKSSNKDLYSRLQFDFYTPELDKVKYFSEHNQVVNFYAPVGNEIMSKISEGNICLIFLAEHNKDFRTTKFLEYSVLRRPFIVIGNKGYVAEFVEQNKLGKAYDESTIDQLETFLHNFSAYLNTDFNKKYDFSEYEFAKVTERVGSLLK